MMIKTFLPRGLFARSLLILIVPLIMVQVITTAVFFDNHWRGMTERLTESLAGDIYVLSEQLVNGNIEQAGAMADVFDIEIVNYTPSETHHVNILQFWENFALHRLRKNIKKKTGRAFTVYGAFHEKHIIVTMRMNDTDYGFIIPERRLFSSSGYIVLLWMTGTSVFLLLIAVMFMRNQIKPIRRLAIAAERFGKGGDTPGFKPTGAREVRQAAEAFLDMRDRIKRQIEQRTLMLAGVSHDLRTPLTRMKLQLEMMTDTEDIRNLKRNLDDMTRMIDGYIDFAKGLQDEPAGMTDITAVIHDIIKSHDTPIHFDRTTPCLVMVRPVAMTRCLDNIISNAADHGDTIHIHLITDEDQCIIRVDDDGQGMPETLYEDAFKPFFRVDTARTESEKHSGLGLSIAQDIMHSHGGDIVLGKSRHNGLSVTLRLPK